MVRYVFYLLAAIAVLTGALDIANGAAGLADSGSSLPPESLRDPMLDNLFRFFAAVWLGLGLQMILFVQDLQRYRHALMLLMGIVILGGSARLVSIADVGLPTQSAGNIAIWLGLVAELLISPALLFWLWRQKG